MKSAVFFLSLAGLQLVDAGIKVDCMTEPECPCTISNECAFWVGPSKNCVSQMVLAEDSTKVAPTGTAIGKTLADAIETCLSQECGGVSACEWGSCPWNDPESPEDPPFPCFPIPGTPSTDGDPHVKTWSGEYFDFHGECDLMLVHSPNLGGKKDNNLDIHARTKIRYGYSFIETAAIRIGDDTLEVSSWGEYAINGVENGFVAGGSLRNAAAGKLGDYPVYHRIISEKQSAFDIVLNDNSNITISNMKDLVSVRVRHGTEFGQVSGLWGNVLGEFMARDHQTIMTDMNEFGREWQVRDTEPMLFRNARAPQYPQQCIMPNVDAKEARRLSEGVDEEAAKIACNHLKNDEREFANCVYDVTATNDLDMADTGAF